MTHIRDQFDNLEMSTDSTEIPPSIDKSSYRAFRRKQKAQKPFYKESAVNSTPLTDEKKTFNDALELYEFIITTYIEASDIRCFTKIFKHFSDKLFDSETFIDILYNNLCQCIKTDDKDGLKYSQLIFFSKQCLQDKAFLGMFGHKGMLSILLKESQERYKKEVEALKNSEA